MKKFLLAISILSGSIQAFAGFCDSAQNDLKILAQTSVNTKSFIPTSIFEESVHRLVNCLVDADYFKTVEGEEVLHEDLFTVVELYPRQIILEVNAASQKVQAKFFEVLQNPLHDGIDLAKVSKKVAAVKLAPGSELESVQKKIIDTLK